MPPLGVNRNRERSGVDALIGFVVVTVTVALIGLYGGSSAASGDDPSRNHRDRATTEVTITVRTGLPETAGDEPSRPADAPRLERGALATGTVTEADGVLPHVVTVFDEVYPGVTYLDPDLLQALRTAAEDASGDDVTFYVTSGWRSPEYQDQLLGEAVSEYGSEAEAARWVATSETSAHLSGEAVDLGPDDAQNWLVEHGAKYGLCQVYANEPWHFELRPEAVDDGCPEMYPDPTYDPRMKP